MHKDQIRKKLLEQRNSNEIGLWKIIGEDPNPDMGGHHHEPELDIVDGKYADIVEYAINLPKFFSWGSGGKIEKLRVPKKIDPVNNKRRATLENQKKKLIEQIALIDKELESV